MKDELKFVEAEDAEVIAELPRGKKKEYMSRADRPLDTNRLWSAKDIGDFLGLSFPTVYSIVHTPEFPKAIRLPNGRGRFSHPRWDPHDVMDYCESYKGV